MYYSFSNTSPFYFWWTKLCSVSFHIWLTVYKIHLLCCAQYKFSCAQVNLGQYGVDATLLGICIGAVLLYWLNVNHFTELTNNSW